jgi:multiple sugar transport system permease protein
MVSAHPAGERPPANAVSAPRRSSFSLMRRQEMIAGYLCVAPWIVGFLFLTAGAMIYGMILAFFRTDLLSVWQFVGLGNFGQLGSDSLFWKSLASTAYYTGAVVPLNTAIALVIAMMLNKPMLGRGVFRTIYYLPSVVSGVAVTIIWIWLFSPQKGPINGFLKIVGIDPGPRWFFSEEWAMPGLIIMSLWGVGGAILIYLAGLQGIPSELYEAAEIDGANSLRSFLAVTVPLMTPTIFFTVVMDLIGSFQIFTQAFIATAGGPNNATLTMVLYLYRKGFIQFQFGYAAAISWVLFVIILVMTALVFRSSSAWVYYESEVKR